MWKNLYDGILQSLHKNWAAYIAEYASQGRKVRDTFFNEVYPYSGLLLFGICLLSCLLYYFYFNKRFGRYYSLRTWFSWLLVTAGLAGMLTFWTGLSSMSPFHCPTSLMITYMAIINTLYALFLFFLFSLLCQTAAIMVRRLSPYDISPMASRTPF